MPPLNQQNASKAGAGLRDHLRRKYIEIAKRAKADVERRQGKLPDVTVVDGRRNVPESNVRPSGEIVYLFDTVARAAAYTVDRLRSIAPEDEGTFKGSFTALVGGAEAPIDNIPAGSEVVIVNRLPYSRRLEKGWSLQAPNGVMEITARHVRTQWRDIRVGFSYVSLTGGSLSGARYPAITLASKVV